MAKITTPLKVEIPISGNIPNLVEIDGIKYILEKEVIKTIDGIEHTQKAVFKKFDEKEYEKNLKVVIDCISKKTTTKELLTHILKNIDMKSLRRLVKRIEDKKPIKKHGGCLGFKIGDAYVQVVD